MRNYRVDPEPFQVFDHQRMEGHLLGLLASAKRPLDAYLADMQKAADLVLAQNAICVLSTIPPHPHRLELARKYNEGLQRLAKERSVPLIDFEREILKRRPQGLERNLTGQE